MYDIFYGTYESNNYETIGVVDKEMSLHEIFCSVMTLQNAL